LSYTRHKKSMVHLLEIYCSRQDRVYFHFNHFPLEIHEISP